MLDGLERFFDRREKALDVAEKALDRIEHMLDGTKPSGGGGRGGKRLTGERKSRPAARKKARKRKKPKGSRRRAPGRTRRGAHAQTAAELVIGLCKGGRGAGPAARRGSRRPAHQRFRPGR